MDLKGFQEFLFPNLSVYTKNKVNNSAILRNLNRCKELLHVQIENLFPKAPKMAAISVENRPSYYKKRTTKCIINKFIWFDLIEQSSIYQPNYRRLFHAYILSKVLIEEGEQIEDNSEICFSIGTVLSAVAVAMTCSLSEIVLCADVLADAVAGGGVAPVDPPTVVDEGGAALAGSAATGEERTASAELVVSIDVSSSKAEIAKNNKRCHQMLKGIHKTHCIQIGKLRAIDVNMRQLLTYTMHPWFDNAVWEFDQKHCTNFYRTTQGPMVQAAQNFTSHRVSFVKPKLYTTSEPYFKISLKISNGFAKWFEHYESMNYFDCRIRGKVGAAHLAHFDHFKLFSSSLAGRSRQLG